MNLAKRHLFALALLGATGCTDFNGGSDPLAPPGLASSSSEGSVDGLTVGHNFMAAGEYEFALKAYQRSVAEDGLTPDILNGMAVAHMKLGRLGEAERLLRGAVSQDQDFGPAWNNLGVLLANTGRYLEAKRTFEIAFGLAGGNSTQIKENIAKVVAKAEKVEYISPNDKNDFELVRRGDGVYLLLETPS